MRRPFRPAISASCIGTGHGQKCPWARKVFRLQPRTWRWCRRAASSSRCRRGRRLAWAGRPTHGARPRRSRGPRNGASPSPRISPRSRSSRSRNPSSPVSLPGAFTSRASTHRSSCPWASPRLGSSSSRPSCSGHPSPWPVWPCSRWPRSCRRRWPPLERHSSRLLWRSAFRLWPRLTPRPRLGSPRSSRAAQRRTRPTICPLACWISSRRSRARRRASSMARRG
mmetsp:Transcript_23927/g.68884  ORF Transcript_23927/g.68884 Transcript_23927/m.68884 type:complete len:225 (+) Transcript_23927:99-773(+)